MCDKISELSDKFLDASNIVESDGCALENLKINECLKDNSHNWSKCRIETQALRNCVNKRNQQNEQKKENRN